MSSDPYGNVKSLSLGGDVGSVSVSKILRR